MWDLFSVLFSLCAGPLPIIDPSGNYVDGLLDELGCRVLLRRDHRHLLLQDCNQKDVAQLVDPEELRKDFPCCFRTSQSLDDKSFLKCSTYQVPSLVSEVAAVPMKNVQRRTLLIFGGASLNEIDPIGSCTRGVSLS